MTVLDAMKRINELETETQTLLNIGAIIQGDKNNSYMVDLLRKIISNNDIERKSLENRLSEVKL